MIPRIKEAIRHYNDNRGKSPKMTMKTLAEKTGTTPWYISRWSAGKNLGQFTPEILEGLCRETGTDPNYIYDYPAK